MVKRSGRFAVSLKLAVGITVTVFISHGSVMAAPTGSVTVTAVVAPVRDVLINDNGKITEIISNCQTNVTPLIYKTSFNSQPLAFSPDIRRQYTAIMAHVDTSHAGVVYHYKSLSAAKKPVMALFVRPHLGLY